MGYALFANRKIMYSNMIFYLQMQLDQLAEERLNNMMFTSNISDGELLPEEIFEDCGNASMYGDYIVNEDLYVQAKINSDQGAHYQLDGTDVTFEEFYWQTEVAGSCINYFICNCGNLLCVRVLRRK